MEIFNNPFVLMVIAIPLFMVTNIIGGVLLAEFNGEFDKEILKSSIVKYLGILIMGLLIYNGGELAGAGINQALGVDLHVGEIVAVGMATYGIGYAYQSIEKFNRLVGVNVNGGEDK